MTEADSRHARSRHFKHHDVEADQPISASSVRAKAAEARSSERLAHLYERPGIKLRRCHQISTALFEQALDGAQLTAPQYGAMVILKEYPGINQVRLGRLLGYDRSTIGSVVAHLVTRGLVERKPDPADGRGRVLTLTNAAKNTMEIGGRASQWTQEKLLEPLSPAQRLAFVAAMDTILDAYNSTTRAPLDSGASKAKSNRSKK